jgi:hypothetical protein
LIDNATTHTITGIDLCVGHRLFRLNGLFKEVAAIYHEKQLGNLQDKPIKVSSFILSLSEIDIKATSVST